MRQKTATLRFTNSLDEAGLQAVHEHVGTHSLVLRASAILELRSNRGCGEEKSLFALLF